MKKQIFDQSSTIINFNLTSFLSPDWMEITWHSGYWKLWRVLLLCLNQQTHFNIFQLITEMRQNVPRAVITEIFFIQKWFVAKNRISLALIVSRDFSKQTLHDKHLGKISLIASSVESASSSSPMSVTALRSDPIRIFFARTKATKATSKESEEESSLIILREGAKVHTLRRVEEGNSRTLLSSLYFLRSFRTCSKAAIKCSPFMSCCALFVFLQETASTRHRRFLRHQFAVSFDNDMQLPAEES